MKYLFFFSIILNLVECKNSKNPSTVLADIDHVGDSTVQISYLHEGKTVQGSLLLSELSFKDLSDGKVEISLESKKEIGNSLKVRQSGKNKPKPMFRQNVSLEIDTFPPIHKAMHILSPEGEVSVLIGSDGFSFISTDPRTIRGSANGQIIKCYKWSAQGESEVYNLICKKNFHDFLDTLKMNNFIDPIYCHFSDTLVVNNTSFFMVSDMSVNGSHKHYKKHTAINQNTN